MSPTLSEDGDAARMQFIKRPVLAVTASEMEQPYDGAVLPDEMSDLDDNEHVHDRLDAQQAHQGSFGALPSSWVGSFKRLVHGAASNSFVRRMQDTANQAAESFKSGYRRRTGGGGGSKADAREDEKEENKAHRRPNLGGKSLAAGAGRTEEKKKERGAARRALAQGATRRGREKSNTRHHVEPPVRSHGAASSSSSSGAKKEVPLIVPPPKRVYFVANAPPL